MINYEVHQFIKLLMIYSGEEEASVMDSADPIQQQPNLAIFIKSPGLPGVGSFIHKPKLFI